MAPNNRYTPIFKAEAVAAFVRRRAVYPNESRASSLQFVASELKVPESTLGGWVRGATERPAEVTSDSIPGGTQEQGIGAAPTQIVVHVPEQPRKGRGLDFVALLISIVAIVWPQVSLDWQHTRDQEKNAQGYFEAVSGPAPTSYETSALQYARALTYTEPNSPAARIITLVSEASRVVQQANLPATTTTTTTKGRTVTRADDVYRACLKEDPNKCVSYHSLEFDEQNRLRSYSFEDNRRLDSMLLNKDQGSSENDDAKVGLIEGAETVEGQLVFVAQVTSKRANERATIDYASASFASGDQRVPTKEVIGPAKLGPSEAVTIVGAVTHARGITVSVPISLQSEDGKSPLRSSTLLIKLY
jgi:hypothetical protein